MIVKVTTVPAKRGRAAKKAPVEPEPEEEIEEPEEETIKKAEPAKDSIIAKLKAADKKENKPKAYHVDKELSSASYSV